MIADFDTSQTARIYGEFVSLLSLVPEQEPSARSDLSALYAKVLAVSAGSEFEDWGTNLLTDAVKKRANDLEFAKIVNERMIERKYFQFFDFDLANFNKIWALFPSPKTVEAKAILKKDDDLQESVRKFMSLNRERNRLVHQNFAGASAEYTVDEIVAMFRQACAAVAWIESALELPSQAVPGGQAGTPTAAG